MAASSGYWLLDMAWNQAASLPQAPTRLDAAELVCLLQAATRLDPKLAEAWRQQYDLQSGLGRHSEALQALGKYVDLAPEDEPVYLAYVAEQVAAGQTAETRLAACKRWLSRRELPGPVASFLHRTTAEILANRLQNEQAILHAQEAVRAFPYDLAARRMLLDFTGRRGPAADLQMALWAVRRNPSDTGAIIQVATLADTLGLYEQAVAWYASAQQVFEKSEQDTMGLGLRMAEHYLDAGQTEQAISRLIAMTSKRRAPAEAWLLLSNAYAMMDKPEQARNAASKALQIIPPASAPASTAASQATQSAPATTNPAGAPAPLEARIQDLWVRMMYMGEDGNVLDDAAMAFDAHRDEVWAHRTYGWALVKADQPDKAVEILTPFAQVDPWCALGLAQAQVGRNDRQAAAQTLQTVLQLAPTGPIGRAARQWSKKVGLALPAPDVGQIHEAQMLLGSFDKALLRLPLEPGEFLQLKLAMDPPPAPGDPWFGRLQLTNISNQPIYCGQDGALMPNVLVSAMTYDPAARDIKHRLLLSLYKQMVLQPKQTVTLYRPLDTGPLRQALRNPYRNVTVMFTAILDPIRTDEGPWQAGPGGLVCEPVTADRPAQQPSQGVDMVTLVRSGSPAERMDLARRITCIIVGLQDRKAAQTQPVTPPASILNQAMGSLLQDNDPTVAARALAQAWYIPLTDVLAKAAAGQVGGDPWLPRLLAIRLFAHKQGQKFIQALGGLSTSDPDPLVRQLAGAYYAAFQKKPG